MGYHGLSKKLEVFDTFVKALRVPGTDLFDQESVNRFCLGYSTCPGLNFEYGPDWPFVGPLSADFSDFLRY